jgi:taurine dioxygenase
MTLLEDRPTYDTVTVDPLEPAIGAEVSGFRMDGDVPPEQVADIRQALLDWKVVFFRDQDVSLEDHIAFGSLFGELEVHPFTPKHYPEHPEVLAIIHDENSKRGQNRWHSDVTWRLDPSLGSILRCRECPAVGGDTLFADMYAAYEGLSDDVKEQIDGASARHSFRHNFGRNMDDDTREKLSEQYPDPIHPVVRTHPETDRKGIYVNAAFTVEILDMDPDESERLLKHLYRQASIPEYQCRFRWQQSSVAFWDNRAVQHYAAFDYHPHRRHVERVTVVGDVPV